MALTPQEIDALETGDAQAPESPATFISKKLSPQAIDALDTRAPTPAEPQPRGFLEALAEPSSPQEQQMRKAELQQYQDRLREQGVEPVELETGQAAGRSLKRVVRPIQAGIQDLGETMGGNPTMRNMVSVYDEPDASTPFEEATKDVKGLPGMLKNVSQAVPDILTRATLGRVLGAAGMSPTLAETIAFGANDEGVDPLQGLIISRIGPVSKAGGSLTKSLLETEGGKKFLSLATGEARPVLKYALEGPDKVVKMTLDNTGYRLPWLTPEVVQRTAQTIGGIGAVNLYLDAVATVQHMGLPQDEFYAKLKEEYANNLALSALALPELLQKIPVEQQIQMKQDLTPEQLDRLSKVGKVLNKGLRTDGPEGEVFRQQAQKLAGQYGFDIAEDTGGQPFDWNAKRPQPAARPGPASAPAQPAPATAPAPSAPPRGRSLRLGAPEAVAPEVAPVQENPEWVKQNIDVMAEPLEANGVADKIEALSAQRKTAKEVAIALGLDLAQVRAVRAKRGIPSLDDKAEFEKWVASKRPAPVTSPVTPPVVNPPSVTEAVKITAENLAQVEARLKRGEWDTGHKMDDLSKEIIAAQIKAFKDATPTPQPHQTTEEKKQEPITLKTGDEAPVEFHSVQPGFSKVGWYEPTKPFQAPDGGIYYPDPNHKVKVSSGQLKAWGYSIPEAEHQKFVKAGGEVPMSFEEFEKQYREAFTQMMKYSPNEAGSQVFAEKMAKLHELNPQWAEAVEKKVATPAAPAVPSFDPPKMPRPPKAGDVDDKQKRFAEYRTLVVQYLDQLEAWEKSIPQTKPIIFESGNIVTAITPDPMGEWRATNFSNIDKMPTGHQLYKTRMEAVKQYINGKRLEKMPFQVQPLPATPAPAQPATAPAKPTEAQILAGNAKLKHIKVHGFDISIENEAGTVRSKIGKGGKPWSVVMPADYGYIKGTVGKDKDHLDVYVGPNHESQHVTIVNQKNLETGQFDEHKIMLGFNSDQEAVQAYDKGFSDGKGFERRRGSYQPEAIAGSVGTTIPALKKWLKEGDTKKRVTNEEFRKLEQETELKKPATAHPITNDPSVINHKVWYHGTGNDQLTPDTIDVLMTNHESLFGPGFYLTDSPKIAEGYSKARRNAKSPTVYEVKVNVGKVLDLEKPITPDVIAAWEKGVYSQFKDEVTESAAKPGATPETVFRAIKEAVAEESHGDMVPTSEYIEMFSNMAMALRDAGYDAMTHTGGKRTGNAAHQVLIMLDPTDAMTGASGRKGQVTFMGKAGEKTAQEKSEPNSKANDIGSAKPWLGKLYYGDVHGESGGSPKPSKFGDYGKGYYVTPDRAFAETFANGTAFASAPKGSGKVFEVKVTPPKNVFASDDTALTPEEISHWENDGEDLDGVTTRAGLIEAQGGRNFQPWDLQGQSDAWDSFLDKFGYDAVFDGEQLMLRGGEVSPATKQISPQPVEQPKKEVTDNGKTQEGEKENGQEVLSPSPEVKPVPASSNSEAGAVTSFKSGDRVRWEPKDKKRHSPVEGTFVEQIKNSEGELGYHILSPLPNDLGRIVRVWARDGVLNKDAKATKVADIIMNASRGSGNALFMHGNTSGKARAEIISIITGSRVPKFKTGIDAMMQALYEFAGITNGSEAQKEKLLSAWVKGNATKNSTEAPAPEATKAAVPVPASKPVDSPAKAEDKMDAQVSKVAKNAGSRPAGEIKAELVEKLTKALGEATDETKGKITIHIPGDGTFTLWNDKKTVQATLERAKAIPITPGWKAPKTPMVRQAVGIKEEAQDMVRHFDNDEQAAVAGLKRQMDKLGDDMDPSDRARTQKVVEYLEGLEAKRQEKRDEVEAELQRQRDALKKSPVLMTEQEFADAVVEGRKDPKPMIKGIGINDNYLKAAEDAGYTPVQIAESLVKGYGRGGDRIALRSLIMNAIDLERPVSSKAVRQLGIRPPKWYKRQGAEYVSTGKPAPKPVKAPKAAKAPKTPKAEKPVEAEVPVPAPASPQPERKWETKTYFHGSRESFLKLRPGGGQPGRFLHGEAIWFAPHRGANSDTSTVSDATRYSGDSGTIIEAKLDIKNPYYGDVDELVRNKIDTKWLKDRGYDAFVDNKSGSGMIAVLSPDQVTEVKREKLGGNNAPAAKPEPETKYPETVVPGRADAKQEIGGVPASSGDFDGDIAKARKAVVKAEDNLKDALKEYEDAHRDQFEAKDKLKWGTPEYVAIMRRWEKAKEDKFLAEGAIGQAQSGVSLAIYNKQVAPFRGKEVPGTRTITAKHLKEQKDNLLGQVAEALKKAPADGTDPITFKVPGDGEFTISNNKDALKQFRDAVAKHFPTTVSTGNGPSLPSTSARGAAKVAEPKPEDLVKLAHEFTSDDESRYTINHAYSDGTQIIATDGRQLLRIVSDKVPGSPDKPVRLDGSGKADEESAMGHFPNWQGIMDPNKSLMYGGMDTADAYHIARQAEVFRNSSEPDKDKRTVVGLHLYVNKDRTLGGSMDVNGDHFEHNLKPDAALMGSLNPDYLINALNVSRKLGNEKVDVYAHGGNSGPVSFVGKNHEILVSGLRMDKSKEDLRDGPDKFVKLAGKPAHRDLPKGFGPLEHPDSQRVRYVGIEATGKFKISLEKGEIEVRIETTTKSHYHKNETTTDWKHVGSVQLSEWPEGDKAQVAMVKEWLKTHQIEGQRASNASPKIREEIKKVIGERDGLIKEGEKRKGLKGSLATEDMPQAESTGVVSKATGVEAMRELINDPKSGLSPEAVNLANAMLDLPVMQDLEWDKVTLELKDSIEGGFAGGARIFDGIIDLARTADPEIFPHEIAHFLSIILPKEEWNAFEQARLEALRKIYGDNIPENLKSGEMSSHEFLDQNLPDDVYPLINTGEYMAYRFAKKIADDFGGKDKTWWQKAYAKIAGWFKGIWEAIKRVLGAKPSLEKIMTDLADGKYMPEPNDVAKAERAGREAKGSLAKNPSSYRLKRALNETGAAEGTAAAYGSLTKLKYDIARRLNASDKAINLLNLPRHQEMADLAFRDIGLVDYYDVQSSVAGGSPALKTEVALSAWHQLGNDQRRFLDLKEIADKQFKLIHSVGFQQKLQRLNANALRLQALENAEQTFKNQIGQQAADVLRQMNEKNKLDAQYDQLREDYKRLQALPQFTKAVAQRIDNMVVVLSLDPSGLQLLVNGKSKSGTEIANAYFTISRNDGHPINNVEERAFVNLAAHVLAVNRDMARKLVALSFFKSNPQFQARVNAVGAQFAKRMEKDPKGAIDGLVKTASKLTEARTNAEAAWALLNHELIKEIDRYNDTQKAVDVLQTLHATPEWKKLVNDIHTDAKADRLPDAVIKDITKEDVFPEFESSPTLISPTGRPYKLTLGFTKTDALNAYQTVDRYLAEVDRWLNDPANADSPDRRFWEDRRDFAEATYYVSTTIRPTSVTPIGLRHSWFIPDYLFDQMNLPAAKVARITFENFGAAFNATNGWVFNHQEQIVNTMALAAKQHRYNLKEGLRKYQTDVLNQMGYLARTGKVLHAGDSLDNGIVLTDYDIKALKTQGEAINALFNLVKNVGREKLMTDRKLVDEWGSRVFGIRAPHELGGETGTTLPHDFSDRGKVLSRIVSQIVQKGGSFDDVMKVLDGNNNFEFVKMFLAQRKSGYVHKLSDFEVQYKSMAQMIRMRDPQAPTTVDDVIDYIEANSTGTLTRDEIKDQVMGEMVNRLLKFYKNFVEPTKPNDVRAWRTSTSSSLTRGFVQDVENSFFYDYGVASDGDVRALAMDASNYHLVRVDKALDSLEQEMVRALDDLKNASDKRKFAKGARVAFESGKDFRDFDALEAQLNEIRAFRKMVPTWTGKNTVEADLVNKGSRILTDVIGARLTGVTTAGRILVGSTFKMGTVFAAMDRGIMLSSARAIASMGISAFKIGLPVITMTPTRMLLNTPSALRSLVTPNKGGISVQIAESVQKVFEGVTEELMRPSKFLRQQYLTGLITDQMLGHHLANMILMPQSRGRGYDARQGTNKAVRGAKQLANIILTSVELPLDVLRAYLPQMAYSVAYDAAARQAGWSIDILEAQARRAFDVHEKLGTINRFNLANPSDPANALVASQVLPQLIVPKTQTALAQVRDWFRAIDIPYEEAVIHFWARLQATPKDMRKSIRLLSGDIADPVKAKEKAERRAVALMSVALRDVHHAAPTNRPWLLRSAPVIRMANPFVGWSAQTTRQLFSTFGKAPHDPEYNRAWIKAITAITILAALGISTVIGDADKRFGGLLKHWFYNEEESIKHLGQGKDAKENVKIAISDATAYISALNSAFNSILGVENNRGGMNVNPLLVEEANSWLKLFQGMLATGDFTYGVEQFVGHEVPLARIVTNRLPEREGIVEDRNAKNLLTKYGPSDLTRPRGYDVGVPNELTPLKETLANAIFQGDEAKTQQAYDAFVQKATAMGRPEPEKLARQVLESLNPYRQVFGATLTEEQRQTILNKMTPGERKVIQDVEDRYSAAANNLNAPANFTKEQAASNQGGSFGGAGAGGSYTPGFRSLGGNRSLRFGRSRSKPRKGTGFGRSLSFKSLARKGASPKKFGGSFRSRLRRRPRA